MAEQTIQLAASWHDAQSSATRWRAPAGSRPEIDAALAGTFSKFFSTVLVRSSNGEVLLQIASDQSELPQNANDDLLQVFETNGSLELIVGSNSLLVALAGADMSEPYIWTPTNSAEVIAFEAMLSDVDGTESGQLIIRDFVPAVTTDHAVDAGDAAFAFAVQQPTVTHTPQATVAHAVAAGIAAFAFAVAQLTVTHTPAATTAALVLSDFVLADGLEAEVLALIEAAEPIDVFSRSPRPGTWNSRRWRVGP